MKPFIEYDMENKIYIFKCITDEDLNEILEETILELPDDINDRYFQFNYLLKNGNLGTFIKPTIETDGDCFWAIENKAETIIFEESFSVFQPVSTAYWFRDMTNLKTIIGLNNLNTSNVTNMRYMFFNCKQLENIDISHFNTHNVENMGYMFALCESLTEINLDNFDFTNVKTIAGIFYGCTKIKELDLTNLQAATLVWDNELPFEAHEHCIESAFGLMSELEVIYVNKDWKCTPDMLKCGWVFKDCYKLIGSLGSTPNDPEYDGKFAQIDGGFTNPGYLSLRVKN